MNEATDRRDRKEMLELAETYLDITRCVGGHLVHRRYMWPL